MKKTVAFILSGILVFSLCACSANSDSENNSGNVQTNNSEKSLNANEADCTQSPDRFVW